MQNTQPSNKKKETFHFSKFQQVLFEPMSITADFLHGRYPRSFNDDIHCMLTLEVHPIMGESNISLDIVAVIDESGSMEPYLPVVKSVLRFLQRIYRKPKSDQDKNR